jgi:hypothetical protein
MIQCNEIEQKAGKIYVESRRAMTKVTKEIAEEYDSDLSTLKTERDRTKKLLLDFLNEHVEIPVIYIAVREAEVSIEDAEDADIGESAPSMPSMLNERHDRWMRLKKNTQVCLTYNSILKCLRETNWKAALESFKRNQTQAQKKSSKKRKRDEESKHSEQDQSQLLAACVLHEVKQQSTKSRCSLEMRDKPWKKLGEQNSPETPEEILDIAKMYVIAQMKYKRLYADMKDFKEESTAPYVKNEATCLPVLNDLFQRVPAAPTGLSIKSVAKEPADASTGETKQQRQTEEKTEAERKEGKKSRPGPIVLEEKPLTIKIDDAGGANERRYQANVKLVQKRTVVKPARIAMKQLQSIVTRAVSSVSSLDSLVPVLEKEMQSLLQEKVRVALA